MTHKTPRVCLLGYPQQTLNYQTALYRSGFPFDLPLASHSVFGLLDDPFLIHTLTERCELLLLPGGGDIDPSFFHQANTASRNVDFTLDHIQFVFLEVFVKAHKPVLGICKGMQLINIFFGGSLLQDLPASSLAIHAFTGRDRMHPIAPASSSAAMSVRCLGENSVFVQTLHVNSAHHQAVNRLGDGLCVLQTAPDGVAETICHRTLPVIGVQWHPERLFNNGADYLRPVIDGLFPPSYTNERN